jgi:hypothetical protein
MKLFAILLVPLLAPALAGAAILPDTIGAYHRLAVSQPTLDSRDLWDEYGLHEYESAAYQNDAARFTATAYQLQDSTGAMAAFNWQRPAAAKVSHANGLAAETATGLMLVRGNYVLVFDGYKPAAPELDAVAGSLIHVDGTPFPTLPGYLPGLDLVPNSDRYITGPAGLQKFDPAIPPSVAAFHYGTEAIFGVFHSPKGDMKLAVFNYPTPQIAMDRLTAFQNLPGALAKRSGPLVAVVVSPPDADEAERVLAQIQYRVEITQQDHIPTRRDNIGNLVVNAFILAGILLVFCVVGGLGVGGLKILRRRGKDGADADAMITLHLE